MGLSVWARLSLVLVGWGKRTLAREHSVVVHQGAWDRREGPCEWGAGTGAVDGCGSQGWCMQGWCKRPGGRGLCGGWLELGWRRLAG